MGDPGPVKVVLSSGRASVVTDYDAVRMRSEECLRHMPAFVRPTVDLGTLQHEIDMTCETADPVDRPRLYHVETTLRCNLRCPFCPRTQELVPHPEIRDLQEVLSYETFVHLLDQMPWVRSVELFHFGEPFMHKDFWRYVQACTDRQVFTVIASNLGPATPEAVDRTFAAGLGYLVMDIDSLDPARYAAARVGLTLARLRDRVQYVLRHPKRPYCCAQMIWLDGAEPYTAEDIARWADAPAPDDVHCKFFDSYHGAMADKGILRPQDLCREAFYGFAVLASGDVVPCVRDWAGESVMGNIRHQSVADIWRGEKFQQFRAAMKSGEKPAMCRRCPEGRLLNARSQPFMQINMFDGEELRL
jgi:radical SAM protein with 4Fe4S-binding SPASM domain